MAGRTVTLWCWAILVVLACIGICAPRWIRWVSARYRTSVAILISVPLSSLLPDGAIRQRLGDDGMAPGNLELLIRTGYSDKPLHVLADLRGEVRIDSPEKALEYVRLGSNKDLAYAWQGCGGLEILRGPGDTNESGMMGMLSPKAWRIGKFTAPVVRQIGAAFVVERWLMLTNNHLGGRPAKVRERVGADGGYRQEEVPIPPLPPLPDTHWGVFGLK